MKMTLLIASLAASLCASAYQDAPGSSVPIGDIRDFETKIVTNAWAAVGGAVSNTVLDAVSSATSGVRRVDGAARPLPKYLHVLDFSDSYPSDAAWCYSQPQDDYGACSAVRDGNTLSRNFDFPFDDRAEFVIRMAAGPGRFASVGVAHVGTNLTEDAVCSGAWSRWYKCLPGRTVDGVNENGVCVEVNVVGGNPRESGWTNSVPSDAVHPLAVVRWVLDNAKDAASAAEFLKEHILFPEGWSQNFHWMIADSSNGTAILENGVVSMIPPYTRAAMTNFRLYPDRDTVGEGQERYDSLISGDDITAQWWTGTYTVEGYRESDLPGITGADLTTLFAYWASKDREAHRGEVVNGKKWWQTLHTSCYDITNGVLRVAVQEKQDWYTFSVPSAGGVKPDAVRETVEPMIASATNAVPRIASGYGEVRADLTVKKFLGLSDWDPDRSEEEFVQKFDGLYWNGGSGQWECMYWTFNTETGEYEFDISAVMLGDYKNPDATELMFPNHTPTHRTPVIVDTSIATTDDVVSATAKVSRIVMGGLEVRADLSAKVIGGFTGWNPNATPVPDPPQEGDIYCRDPVYRAGEWHVTVEVYTFNGSEYYWFATDAVMEGAGSSDEFATELYYPYTGVRTTRGIITKASKLATTNDLAAKVDKGVKEIVVGEGASTVDDYYYNYRIAVGKGAKAQQDNSIAVGRETYATRFSSVAIGTYAVSTNQNAVSIGRSARSHGVDTFNVAHPLGSWYAGDVPLLDALFSTGYSEAYVEEVVTNAAPPMATGRLAAGGQQIVTNRFRVYVPDPNAPKPVMSGRETAADLAAMLADVITNSTSDCDAVIESLSGILSGTISEEVRSRKHLVADRGVGLVWEFQMVDMVPRLVAYTNDTAVVEANEQ